MALTPILGITQVATNQSSKETTINDAILALEAAGNALMTLDYSNLPSGSYVLAETDFTRNFLFKALNATSETPTVTLQLPATANGNAITRIFVVSNQSSQALTVVIESAPVGSSGATGLNIPNGASRLVCMDTNALYIASDAATISRFIDLADVPGSYTGNAGKTFRVKSTEDGIEFAPSGALADLSDVTTAGVADGDVLRYSVSSSKWTAAALTLVSAFVQLSDVPNSYAGKAGYLLHVNAASNALEFINPSTLGGPVTAGGNTGQVLTKNSPADGDYNWATPEGLPTGGGTGQYLVKNSANNYDAGWASGPASELPAGGGAGLVLAKHSATDGDVVWQDPKALIISYAPCVINALSVSLISGDHITLPFTPTVGNALIVAYFSVNAITVSTGWSVLSSLAASSDGAWAGGKILGRVVQAGDSSLIIPAIPGAADAAVIYEVDARYIRGGLTSLNVAMGYSNTALPNLVLAQTSAAFGGVFQKLGAQPAVTISGFTTQTIPSQFSSAGGNRYATGFYVDPTSGAGTLGGTYTLPGGSDGAYFTVSASSILTPIEEAPVDFNIYARRNKAWVTIPPHAITLVVGDEVTPITTGATKLTYRMPYNMALQKVKASLSTASSAGVITVDVKRNGSTIFSTPLSINAATRTTVGATIAAVIAQASLANDDEITIDINAAGTGATGLKVYLVGTPS